MPKQQPEYNLHKMIAAYLRLKYPSVMFLSDLDNQIRLTPQQASRNRALQKDGFSCPDLIIFAGKGEWKGLLMEIKAESPFRKDGALRKSEHLERQWESIRQLRRAGFFADFFWNFDTAIKTIDWYLGDRK
jgi:hypothetical protein